jgi:hypothetical protein
MKVEHGMLQASVLGQILFMLNINDLTETTQGGKLVLLYRGYDLLITRKREFDIQNKIINV